MNCGHDAPCLAAPLWQINSQVTMIGRPGPLAPFGHHLRVQAVAGGKGPGVFLRRLEFGSKTGRYAGAAVKNTSHIVSST